MKNETNINETNINLERGKEMNKENETVVAIYGRERVIEDLAKEEFLLNKQVEDLTSLCVNF